MKTIHPAIAEHVMEENERLRGLLEAALFYVPHAGLRADISAALSQQAEPAPAQDEREAFEAWVRDHLPGTQERFPDGVYRDWSIECAWQGYQARPAQTEQQPEQSGLRAIHAMILNALDRDAVEGKAVRGEMAAELRAALAAQGESHE